MITYVLGFLFDDHDSKIYDRVVLVKKNRPLWQAGLYNGVGGRVERDEEPLKAMIREFKEEAGIKIDTWHEFAVLGNWEICNNWQIHCFYAKSNINVNPTIPRTMTDEPIIIADVSDVVMRNIKCVPNLNWLLSMAINAKDGLDRCLKFSIQEAEYRIERV
jgi:8-oxo-dGTP pyrophosphatase MutT (NUDIX family)